MVTVPGSAEVIGLCVSCVFLSLWEQRESESVTDLSRMPEKKTDTHGSVLVDGLEVPIR